MFVTKKIIAVQYDKKIKTTLFFAILKNVMCNKTPNIKSTISHLLFDLLCIVNLAAVVL